MIKKNVLEKNAFLLEASDCWVGYMYMYGPPRRHQWAWVHIITTLHIIIIMLKKITQQTTLFWWSLQNFITGNNVTLLSVCDNKREDCLCCVYAGLSVEVPAAESWNTTLRYSFQCLIFLLNRSGVKRRMQNPQVLHGLSVISSCGCRNRRKKGSLYAFLRLFCKSCFF